MHLSNGTTDTIPVLVKPTVSQRDKLESDNDPNKSKKVQLRNGEVPQRKDSAALRTYQPHPGNQGSFLK